MFFSEAEEKRNREREERAARNSRRIDLCLLYRKKKKRKRPRKKREMERKRRKTLHFPFNPLQTSAKQQQRANAKAKLEEDHDNDVVFHQPRSTRFFYNVRSPIIKTPITPQTPALTLPRTGAKQYQSRSALENSEAEEAGGRGYRGKSRSRSRETTISRTCSSCSGPVTGSMATMSSSRSLSTLSSTDLSSLSSLSGSDRKDSPFSDSVDSMRPFLHPKFYLSRWPKIVFFATLLLLLLARLLNSHLIPYLVEEAFNHPKDGLQINLLRFSDFNTGGMRGMLDFDSPRGAPVNARLKMTQSLRGTFYFRENEIGRFTLTNKNGISVRRGQRHFCESVDIEVEDERNFALAVSDVLNDRGLELQAHAPIDVFLFDWLPIMRGYRMRTKINISGGQMKRAANLNNGRTGLQFSNESARLVAASDKVLQARVTARLYNPSYISIHAGPLYTAASYRGGYVANVGWEDVRIEPGYQTIEANVYYLGETEFQRRSGAEIVSRHLWSGVTMPYCGADETITEDGAHPLTIAGNRFLPTRFSWLTELLSQISAKVRIPRNSAEVATTAVPAMGTYMRRNFLQGKLATIPMKMYFQNPLPQRITVRQLRAKVFTEDANHWLVGTIAPGALQNFALDPQESKWTPPFEVGLRNLTRLGPGGLLGMATGTVPVSACASANITVGRFAVDNVLLQAFNMSSSKE